MAGRALHRRRSWTSEDSARMVQWEISWMEQHQDQLTGWSRGEMLVAAHGAWLRMRAAECADEKKKLGSGV